MTQQAAINPLVQLFPIVIIFVIFYFLLIRPQKQQEKKHKEMIMSLKKNSEVVTICGIHGTIVNVKESTFILRVDDNTKVEIDKTAIARVTKAAS